MNFLRSFLIFASDTGSLYILGPALMEKSLVYGILLNDQSTLICSIVLLFRISLEPYDHQ